MLERCVGDVATFRTQIWGRRPLVTRADGESAIAFGDVFSLTAVDELIASAARTPTVRMVEGGSTLPASQFCTPVRLGGRHLDDVVDPTKVVARLADGATLVLQSLHRTWPSVAAFVGRLQSEMSHPCQANAYLTPPSASGLAEHSDLHDVIALQLHGSKHWWVEGIGDVTLRPGDTMYLPRGTRHSAATATDTSLHLTIGVIRVTYRQVLERLLRDGPHDFDDPLPIGYRHQARRPELERGVDESLDQLLELVGSADLADLVDAEQSRRQVAPQRPGRIASIAHVGSLTVDSIVRWIGPEPLVRTRADLDDAVAGERVVVDLGDRTLTLPASALAALGVLGTGSPVRVATLPGLDEPSRVVLASRLVREGACVIDQLLVS